MRQWRPLVGFGPERNVGYAVQWFGLAAALLILYLAKGACERHCVERLYTIRQIRLAQGKNIDRLQRLMLWNREGVDDEQRQTLQVHFPGQLIAPVGDAAPRGMIKDLEKLLKYSGLG